MKEKVKGSTLTLLQTMNHNPLLPKGRNRITPVEEEQQRIRDRSRESSLANGVEAGSRNAKRRDRARIASNRVTSVWLPNRLRALLRMSMPSMREALRRGSLSLKLLRRRKQQVLILAILKGFRITILTLTLMTLMTAGGMTTPSSTALSLRGICADMGVLAIVWDQKSPPLLTGLPCLLSRRY
jgi:hypothetical protein